MKLLKNFLIISRANIQIASLPTAALGIVLASRNWEDIFNLPVLLYILLFFTILTYSCNINCVNDLRVDEKSKKHLSDAVKAIGIQKLKTVLAIELFVSIIIIISLCILKKDMIYLLAVGGILCGYSYSSPPLRIKKRGILSPFPVIFGLYFLPIIAGWYIVANRLSIFVILFATGYALIMQGITFINTCEDFEEDRTFGIQTIAHVFGARTTLFLGTIFVSVGGVLVLFLILFNKMQPIVSEIIPFLLILIISVFFLISITRISKRLYFVSRSNNPLSLSKQETVKMRIWFLTTRYPLLFISLLLIS